MNRTLLVTLLRKEIQELDMITEGFMEINEYPKAIILLAQRKTEDIQGYIKQLAEFKTDISDKEIVVSTQIDIPTEETKPDNSENLEISEPIIDTNTQDEIQEEIISAQEFTSELIESEKIQETELEEMTLELVIDTISPEKDIVETKNIEIEEKSAQTVSSLNEIHSKPDNTLGSVLANKKISDIKQAINIGERFLFQRELFKGNGEDMNKTLNYINQLATLDEALSFLQSKYNWNADNETVIDFLQIIKRRFI